MSNATLETYIQTARNQGLSEEVIWSKFLEMGWNEIELQEAMGGNIYPAASPLPHRHESVRVPSSASRFRLRQRTKALLSKPRTWLFLILAALLATIAYIILSSWK